MLDNSLAWALGKGGLIYPLTAFVSEWQFLDRCDYFRECEGLKLFKIKY